MRYRASFLVYAFWVHKNATPKNWLMQVKGLNFFDSFASLKCLHGATGNELDSLIIICNLWEL